MKDQQFLDIIKELTVLQQVKAPSQLKRRVEHALIPSLPRKITTPAFLIPKPALFAILLLIGVFSIAGTVNATNTAKQGDMLYPVKQALEKVPFIPTFKEREPLHVVTPSLSPSPHEATHSATDNHSSHDEDDSEQHPDNSHAIPKTMDGFNTQEHGSEKNSSSSNSITPPGEDESDQVSKGIQGELERDVHAIFGQPDNSESVKGSADTNIQGKSDSKNGLKGGDE